MNDKLQTILENHNKWVLTDGREGERANLSGAEWNGFNKSSLLRDSGRADHAHPDSQHQPAEGKRVYRLQIGSHSKSDKGLIMDNISPERQYVIVNNEHSGALRGALLFWGEITPDESPRRSFGRYTQDMNKCERYTLQEALSNHKYPVYGEDCDNENYRYLEDFLIRIDQLEELGYTPRLVYVMR